MIPANYQHAKNEDFNTIISEDGQTTTKIIAGEWLGKYGKISTQTPVNAFMIDAKAKGKQSITFPKMHQGLLYLLKGRVKINDNHILEEDKNQLLQFHQDGEGFTLEAVTESELLFLSGEPLNEKVTTYGFYVMNTQTEIMEAMRDYQMGKMGFLHV